MVYRAKPNLGAIRTAKYLGRIHVNSPKIIAVIDDDPAMLKAVERLLRAKGFDVEAFASAEAFLEAAGASKADLSRSGYSFGRDVRHRVAAPTDRFGVRASNYIHHRPR